MVILLWRYMETNKNNYNTTSRRQLYDVEFAVSL